MAIRASSTTSGKSNRSEVRSVRVTTTAPRISTNDNTRDRIDPTPTRVLGATERVRQLLERVNQATRYTEENLDRLLGSQPETDGDSSDMDKQAGEANELHANLAYLEIAVKRLEDSVQLIGAL